MKIDHSKNQVIVTEFEVDEDGNVATLATKNLDLTHIDKEKAHFEILNQRDWFAHARDGAGDGCGSGDGKFYRIGKADKGSDEFFTEWIALTFDFFAKYELNKKEAIKLHRVSIDAFEQQDDDEFALVS